MEYIRTVDFAAIDKSGADERLTQSLFDHTSGARNCTINCIKTPAGGGSPAGIRHRNWNSSGEHTVHLAFNTPLPDPDLPFAKSV